MYIPPSGGMNELKGISFKVRNKIYLSSSSPASKGDALPCPAPGQGMQHR